MESSHERQNAVTPLPGWTFGLALCVLGGLLWYWPVPPRYLTPDSVDFLRYAFCIQARIQESIEAGWTQAGPGGSPLTCDGASHWPSGHPLLLWALLKAGLEPVTAVRLLSLFPAALLPLPLFFLGRALKDARAGLWAAALIVPCVSLRTYALYPDARLGGLLFTFAAYAALIEGWMKRRPGLLVWAGIFSGLTISFRAEGRLNAALVLLALVCLVGNQVWTQRGFLALPLRARMSAFGQAFVRACLRPMGAVLAGLLAVLVPLQVMVIRLAGQVQLEPRGWEVPISSWTAFLPVYLFLPLFEAASQPSPLRQAVQQSLDHPQYVTPLAERLVMLLDQLGQNLPRMPGYLSQTVPLVLGVLALVGAVVLLRQPSSPRSGVETMPAGIDNQEIRSPRRLALRGAGGISLPADSFQGVREEQEAPNTGLKRAALWSLTLLPLLPLSAFPQAFNPRLPEANLLFVPMALALLAGVAVSGAQDWIESRGASTASPARARLRAVFSWGIVLSLLVSWARLEQGQYRALLQERGGTPFDSSPIVQKAAAWVELYAPPEVPLIASVPVALIPLLSGHQRISFPSFWEVRSVAERWHETRTSDPSQPLPLLVLSSVDQLESPLVMREWLKVEPGLKMVFFAESQGHWVAILSF